jgi:nucleoid DNA-binding protein
LANQTGLTQQQVHDVVQGMLDNITKHLSDGDQIVMRNFGTFQLRRTKPRVGRNPAQPKTNVAIPERTIVRFKPGKDLQNQVIDILPKPD